MTNPIKTLTKTELAHHYLVKGLLANGYDKGTAEKYALGIEATCKKERLAGRY